MHKNALSQQPSSNETRKGGEGFYAQKNALVKVWEKSKNTHTYYYFFYLFVCACNKKSICVCVCVCVCACVCECWLNAKSRQTSHLFKLDYFFLFSVFLFPFFVYLLLSLWSDWSSPTTLSFCLSDKFNKKEQKLKWNHLKLFFI
jgi:hypothetical protein